MILGGSMTSKITMGTKHGNEIGECLANRLASPGHFLFRRLAILMGHDYGGTMQRSLLVIG